MQLPQPARPLRLGIVSLASVCFVAFALYTACVRLVPFHDDSHIIARIRDVSILGIFDPASSDGVEYRPAGTAFWLLTRDLFGWFVPGMLHMWNVFAHVLNTALVAALTRRLLPADLARRGRAMPIAFVVALLFALFPQSYQGVIAGAIYHPIMLLFGLAALHAFISFRQHGSATTFAACGAFLCGACFSHEAGFVFGPLLVLVDVTLSDHKPVRLRWQSVVLAMAALAYPIAYRIFISSMWTPERGMLTDTAAGLADKVIYYLQGLMWWVVVPLKPVLGLSGLNDATRLMLVIATVLGVGAGLWLLCRTQLWRLGLFGLAWWVITLAPNVAALPMNYITDTPRLMLVPSVGIALFWGACLCALLGRIRRPAARLLSIATVTLLLAWCAGYIFARQLEAERLAVAFRYIDHELRDSPADTTVTLVNPPFLMLPATSAFPFGREGFSLWEPNPGYGPISHWLGALSGSYRDGQAVRHVASLSARDPNSGEHDKSFTLGQAFKYGVFGPGVDDAGLRQIALASDFTFRFDYDAPGLRLRQMARIQPVTDAASSPPLATFTRDKAQVELVAATAIRCRGHVWVRLAWRNSGDPFEPTGVFIHGYDANARQVLTADKDLLDGVLPVNELPHTMVVTETREIGDPATDAPVGNVDTIGTVQSVRVGLYARADTQRFTATQAKGDGWPGDEVDLPVVNDSDTVNALCAIDQKKDLISLNNP